MTKEELEAMGRQCETDRAAWEKARDEANRLLKIAQKSQEDFVTALATEIRGPAK